MNPRIYIKIFYFLCIVITWIVTRLVLFPYVCIYPSYIWLHTKFKHEWYIHGYILVWFMMILYVLHWYWFSLLYKVAKKVILGKDAVKDIRSGSETD